MLNNDGLIDAGDPVLNDGNPDGDLSLDVTLSAPILLR